MRPLLGSALICGLLVAACASSDDPQAVSTPQSSATSSIAPAASAVPSTEGVDPTTTQAQPEPPIRSIPPSDISADLQQPFCGDLAPLLNGLVQPPLVPIGARAVGMPNSGCEILYSILPTGTSVTIGRLRVQGLQHYLLAQRTKDADEASVHWDTGSVAYIDLTGFDVLHLSGDAHVLVDRSDGSTLYVAAYDQADESLAAAIAQEFDNRLG